ncbi:MAG: extracellular solute-binding protein [Lachnospiraceae bacterium]|nr:extracellular solute-binding protein [Lachnospiraceae bacterium]
MGSSQESSSQENVSSSDESGTSGEAQETPEEFTYPMEPVKLTINYSQEENEWGSLTAEQAFSDPEKYLMGGIGALSQGSGAYIETNGVSLSSDSEEFMYMLISHDLPDIIVNNFNKTYKGGPSAAIDEGYIIDLNEHPEWMPNYLAYLEENPDVRSQVTTDDGRIWCFANIEDTAYGAKDRGLVLRKDILDELQMEVPTTIDEFEAVLRAVKEKYPNMIPFSSEMRWLYMQWMFSSVSNAYQCSYPFYSVDGKTVQFAMYDDNYRAFLERLNQWWKDGLLDPDFPSANKGEVRGKLAKGELFAANQQASNSATSVKNCEVEGAEFIAIPALKMEESDKVYNYALSGIKTLYFYNFSVSTSCENVEAAMRYCDYCFSEEGQTIYSFGLEGLSYTRDAQGNIQLLPEEERWKDEKGNGLAKRTCWAGEVIGEGMYMDEIQKGFADVYARFDAYAGTDTPMNDEESGVYGSYFADLDSFCQEKMIGLVLGTESFDNWETIKATCKDTYHADEVLAAVQSAYTRNMN